MSDRQASETAQLATATESDSNNQFIGEFLNKINVTKAEPGADNLIVPDYAWLADGPIQDKLGEKSKDINALLELERTLMLQLERIDTLLNVLSKVSENGQKSSDNLRNELATRSGQMDALFDHLMGEVKKADRKYETAAWCLDVFFQEAKPTDKVRNSLYILNMEPEKFVKDNDLEKTFRPLKATGNIHRNNYGLWVIGAKVKSDDAPSKVGRIAEAHSAVAMMDVDTDTLFPIDFRCDDKGKRLGGNQSDPTAPGSARAAKSLIKPIEEKQLDGLRDILKGTEGLDHVVLGLNPIRVRRETRYECNIVLDDNKPNQRGLGDVVVPLSYVFGGKTFFQSMVSSQAHVGTAVARGIKQSQIGGYSISPLYSHEGNIDLLSNRAVVSAFGITGWQEPDDLKASLNILRGLHTAGDIKPNNVVSFVLSREYLRRIMTIYARGINGSEIQQIDSIASMIQAVMVQSLVGSGPDKPFTELEVLVDKTSEKGQKALAQNGVRLEVKVTYKAAISSVFVVIKPESVAAKLAKSAEKG